MTAPKELIELIDRFERNLEAYKSGAYNETQVRHEFVDPFFELLGWDINNKRGFAENYKDVVHEDSLKVGFATKAPDYCFRVGGARKFFVEAKKPSVRIKEDISPAYQIKRYAWSAKLALSILTDFEEFAVYDCRKKPNARDSAAASRMMYLTYKDYVEKWDELVSIFSKEAIQKGAFDKFAEGGKKKRGTDEVDDAFLEEIESWREMLAKNLAQSNPSLGQRELNFAVQRTIDRIIFLRICEDRSIEHYGQLQALLNGNMVYARLVELFRKADDRYNSGLFHFSDQKDRAESPDELTLALKIEDGILKDIIKRLYYPDSPYEFSVLPADILGQVYERFLGKVIRLTEGHRAVVEEKPEVRKAGGIYYTPTYIVEYIVKNTVGKLAEGKTPREVEKLRILDPACGSGSFLIGAYQYLIDWHLEWYVKDDAKKWAVKKNPPIFQGLKGEWRLTTAEKKRILLNNIYGVDIDNQAVEVTKLSLLLKVLEGETEQSLNTTLRMFHERALPDLGSNIKCGNSLIGPDFYSSEQMSLAGMDEEEKLRINVFDWNAGFPEIMKAGGFDAVIGNPPYVLGRETFNESWKEYIAKKYQSYGGKFDLYVFFTEKALFLLKETGKLGYILPNTILANVNATLLRKTILAHSSINAIRVFDKRVFEAAQVESVILTLTRDESKKSRDTNMVKVEKEQVAEISQSLFNSSEDFKFNINADQRTSQILGKINTESVNLGKLSNICIGIQLGGSFGKEKKEGFLANRKKDKTYQKVLDGKDINRYQMDWPGVYVRYGKWLHRKRDEKYFLNRKIIVRQIGAKPIATYDEDNYYTLNTIYNILILESQYHPKFILSIINSRLGQWMWTREHSDFKTLFPKIKKEQLEGLSIRTINFSDPAEKVLHDQMVTLVDRMLDLHKQLAKANLPHDKEALQRQIDATDQQIDKLVYELYGLTEEEKKVVEGEGK